MTKCCRHRGMKPCPCPKHPQSGMHPMGWVEQELPGVSDVTNTDAPVATASDSTTPTPTEATER